VKTFLNRRNAVLSGGPSHLVAVSRSTHPAAADPGEPAVVDEAPHDSLEADIAGAARAVPTLRAVPVVPSQFNGRPVQIADGAAFEALCAGKALATFRVFRSFNYTVSLFFHAPSLSYYVALHQDGTLWRALKANDVDAAGAAFHHLEEQATRLADGETRRAQLIAQNEQLLRQVEESEALAERLRANLQRNAEQEHRVTGRQHQVRKEVAQLEAQRIAAQAQLNKAHRTIHQLSMTTNEGVPHMTGR
jgi:hypothetical protein